MKGTPATPHPALRPLRGLFLSLALTLLAASTGLAASAPVPITAIQIDETGHTVRLAAMGTLKSSISHLNNPVRTVVDLTPARLAIKGTGTVSLPVSIGDTIDKVRLGQYQSDTVRVVIEHPANYGHVNPVITPESEQLAISFATGAEILAGTAPGSLPVPTLPTATVVTPDSVAIGLIDAALLADLPVTIDASASGGTVLFEYPEAASYTVWLERFPNRLVFETPARPADIAASAINYELTEVAQIDQPMVSSVRVYTAPGGYTKVVCYMTSFVAWTDRLVEAGIEVSVTSEAAPVATGSASNAVPFSGKEWIAPGATEPAWDPAAIQGDQNEAEMHAAAGDTDESIRINNIEASADGGGAYDAPIEGLKGMGGAINDRMSGNADGLSGISGGSGDSAGPQTYMTPSMPEIAPMAEKSAPALYLFKGESVIIPVNRLVRTSVGDPEVLAINVLSQNELLLTAKGAGRTSLITWEEGVGRTIRTIDCSVSNEGRRQELAQILNASGVNVSFVGDKTVVLEGDVMTEAMKNRAELIAKGAAENVVNLIEITNADQVLIKVRMVELNNRDKDELFRQFGAGSKTESGDFSFGVLSDLLSTELPTGGLFDLSLKPGIVNNSNVGDVSYDPLDFFLKALETSRRAKILSQPNIVTMAGHEAKFRVGGEVPYTFQNERGVNVVDFREFGIELIATPTVDSQGMITVILNPTVRTVDYGLAVQGIPGFRTRTVTTNVQIDDEQTLVIGGLIQREVSEATAKVPVLGDLPLIGSLFRSKSKQDDETELLIFLTLSILKDPTDVQAQIYNEDDVRAGGVADERYTFYSEHQATGTDPQG